MISGPYSPLKIIHHQDRLQQLREGKQINPAMLQLIISDLCNHDCSFCVLGSSIIETSVGLKPISDVVVGDRVLGADGVYNEVTQISSRRSGPIYTITVGDKRLSGTGEHPILTKDGWKNLRDITPGTTVVCMRVWSTSNVSSWDLEQLSEESSTKGWNDGARKEAGFRTHEAKQPNEESRCGKESFSDYQGQTSGSFSSGKEEHIGSCSQAYVDEESRMASSQSSQGVQLLSGSSSVQTGIAFREMGSGKQLTHNENWGWKDVAGSSQSRLQDYRSEEVYRSDDEHGIHRKTYSTDDRRLCNSEDKSLSEGRVAMSGGLRSRLETAFAEGTDRSNQGLCIEGIQLERSLGLQEVDSVSISSVEEDVYNLTCLPSHTYIANGIVVHNCAYRMSGYPSNELFKVIQPDGRVNNNPNRMISYDKIIEILDDCEVMGTRAIEITGGGEPTVHPRFLDIIKYILFTKKFQLGLVTNGYVLRPDVPEALAHASWVRVSIDAGTPETYASIRRLKEGALGKTIENVKRLVKAKQELGSKLIIGIGYVVTKENYHELREFMSWASELGVDNIRFSAVFQPDDFEYHRYHYERVKDDLRWIKDYYSSIRIFDLFGDRVEDLRQQRPEYEFCGYQQFMTYIGADLSVYRCCNTAYNPHGYLGSLKDQRFIEMWNSDEKRERIASFVASSCERCMFNNKNRVINYALEQSPEHVDFV